MAVDQIGRGERAKPDGVRRSPGPGPWAIPATPLKSCCESSNNNSYPAIALSIDVPVKSDGLVRRWLYPSIDEFVSSVMRTMKPDLVECTASASDRLMKCFPGNLHFFKDVAALAVQMNGLGD